MRIGLATWAFIPASKHRSWSAIVASAVRAIIGNIAGVLVHAELARGLIAIHFRHVAIHQDQAGTFVLDRFERLDAISREPGCQAGIGQQSLHDLPVDLHVLGNQDIQPMEARQSTGRPCACPGPRRFLAYPKAAGQLDKKVRGADRLGQEAIHLLANRLNAGLIRPPATSSMGGGCFPLAMYAALSRRMVSPPSISGMRQSTRQTR